MNIANTFEERPTMQFVRAFGQRDTFETETFDRQSTSDDELLDSYSKPLSEVVEKVGPTVVNIRAHHINPASPNAPEAGGTGSGFVISPPGFILTNIHVLHGAPQLVVTLRDS